MESRRVLFHSPEGCLEGPAELVRHLADWLQTRGWETRVASRSDDLETLCRDFGLVVANTLSAWPIVRAAYAAGRPSLWLLHELHVPNELSGQMNDIRATLYLADMLVTPSAPLAELYEGMVHSRVEVLPYGWPATDEAAKSTSDMLRFAVAAPTEAEQKVLRSALAKLDEETRRRIVCDDFSATELTATDVFLDLAPDRTTTLPLLKAMSLAKPIICADSGGVADWLRDGMNAWLFAPGDSQDLARALAVCLNDAPARSRIAPAAQRTFARRFNFERYASGFSALLEQVARHHGSPRPKPARDYAAWLARYDVLTRDDRISLRRKLRHLPHAPRISIILPVYNPDLKFLAAAIDSVRQQLYENWELCVADDASTDSRVKPFLERMAAFDPRIRLTFREKNGHISACSNSALALATGEWCAFLDQDDALADDALAHLVLEMARQPAARLFYSDEDKIDVAGVRSNPYFKPDWNPELFLGQNFVNHLAVYEMALVREVGGLREGFEGSQDYDLAARCVDRVRPEQIRHLPRILYHWRSVPGSLAGQVDAKPYARDAARRALREHLDRRGIAGRVEACRENKELHRVAYALPDPLPLVSVIIPLRDRVELLQRCLESFRLTNYPKVEVVLVDNGSREEETLRYLRELETEGRAKVLRDDGPFNFSRLNNEAARQARGEILAFLNNDIEIIEPDWLREMVSHAARAEVGAVGARLWYRDETLQHGGVVLGLGGVAGHAHHRAPRSHQGYFSRAFLTQNVGAVTGACLVTRREVFAEMGGFNERDLGINFNDIEYCVRLRARGLQVIWTPYANLRHDESGSRGHHRAAAEQAQFFREANFMQEHYGDALLHDPAYNPNLSLLLPGYELAFPPRN